MRIRACLVVSLQQKIPIQYCVFLCNRQALAVTIFTMQVPEETLAWLDDVKQDVEQWAALMPRDADGAQIDWDWIRSLDLIAGIGAGASLDLLHDTESLTDITELLSRDYATRRRIEAVLAMTVRTFMGDFDRTITSFRLPRALAYANRRLNDEIALLIAIGHDRGLWVAQERNEHGTNTVLLTEGPNWPEGKDMHDVQDHSIAIDARRREISAKERTQRDAQRTLVAHATGSEPANATTSSQSSQWRRAYLPGRAVDTVMGIDLETTGINPWRNYIIDAGFEFMNMRSPLPIDAVQKDLYVADGYKTGDAYGQARLSFGVPQRCAQVDHPFIRELTGIDVRKLASDNLIAFDEWPSAQRALLQRLEQQPYVAHNATFEHKYFQFNVEGYAERYRDGGIIIIDTLPMSQFWDESSQPTAEHPHGNNTLDAYAKRMGAMPQDQHERHLGLEDAHIMLVAMKHQLQELEQTGRGPWGRDGKFGLGGKQCHTRH